MKPEDASAREVKKIIGKLIADITTLVNSSHLMNKIVQEQ
jgi:hypothetical protein